MSDHVEKITALLKLSHDLGREDRDHPEQDDHDGDPGGEQPARAADPGRTRSGAIVARGPAIHDLTLDTAFKKRQRSRRERTEGGERGAGLALGNRGGGADTTVRSE